MHKSWKSTQKMYLEMSSQLEMAYDEIKKLKKENMTIEERTLNELKDTESEELQRLVESINVGGSELERRMGEATRKLVTERMERMRYGIRDESGGTDGFQIHQTMHYSENKSGTSGRGS